MFFHYYQTNREININKTTRIWQNRFFAVLLSSFGSFFFCFVKNLIGILKNYLFKVLTRQNVLNKKNQHHCITTKTRRFAQNLKYNNFFFFCARCRSVLPHKKTSSGIIILLLLLISIIERDSFFRSVYTCKMYFTPVRL